LFSFVTRNSSVIRLDINVTILAYREAQQKVAIMINLLAGAVTRPTPTLLNFPKGTLLNSAHLPTPSTGGQVGTVTVPSGNVGFVKPSYVHPKLIGSGFSVSL